VVRYAVTRSVLVLALAVGAGAIAWLFVHDRDPAYERTLSFAILPGAAVANDDVPDALRALEQGDARVAGTIAAVVGSEGFVRSSARPSLRRQLDERYDFDVGVRPASAVIEIKLRGRSAKVLALLSQTLRRSAPAWVARTYRAYRLVFLSTEAPAGAVSPRARELAVLAALLGALGGGGVVYVEGSLRRRTTAEARWAPVRSVAADDEGEAPVARGPYGRLGR
jgi:hypothetical protein